MTPEALVNVLEAALLAAGRALTLDDFLALFIGSADAPDRKQLRDALAQLEEDLSGRGIELVEVASGYRLQVRNEYSSWLAGLFSERPPRYSRALLETLALIAYRQPITRGEIEDVRGVAVSSNIVKTLMEREWIRVLGHREVPGRPALYGTTREFLDHFGLKSLEGLPPLADIRDLDQVAPDLFAPAPADPESEAGADEGVPNGSVTESGSHDAGGDEQEASTESAGEGAASDDSMPQESLVNTTDASVDLGGVAVDTESDADAPPVVGTCDETHDDTGGESQNEDDDIKIASLVDEAVDGDGAVDESQRARQGVDDADDRDDDTGGQDDETERGEPYGRR